MVDVVAIEVPDRQKREQDGEADGVDLPRDAYSVLHHASCCSSPLHLSSSALPLAFYSDRAH